MEGGNQVAVGLLVGGALGVKKILWVRWSDTCKPKSGGGLGMRDLKVVNLCLLIRQVAVEDPNWGDALWRRVLVSKYAQAIY